MSLLRVPCGSHQKCRFAFSTRALTEQERKIFEAGGTLPDGIGVDPSKVLVEYEKPHNDQIEVLEGSAVVREARGEYHVLLTIGMDQAGMWQWRGRGEEESSAPFACTPPQSFAAYRAF